MAKLYFRYGAMGSSKSANILMVRYNYEERGQYAVLLKPRTDNRDGEHEIKSRIGLEAPAEYVDEFLTINEQISNFAQTYPTNLEASSNEALLFMRRYRFANCSCFSCCFKDAYPSSNVQ